MRIALVAPLAEAVPPKLYGGTERVVCWLAEALVRQGHKVTLFASAESETAAELVVCAPQSLRLAGIRDHLGSTLAMLREVRRRADDFDIIHFHVDLLPQALFHDLAHKCLVTLHGRLDLPDALPLYRAYPEMPLVSISNAQRRPMPPNVNWLATIPHGLPPRVCPFNPDGGGYLAFLGRISPEKRPDRAIEIAKRAGIPLKIAAKVDAADMAYFKTEIEPLLDHPLVEFIGEIGETQKCDFLGKARALLFPIDWPEPFGLVMIEAMSAGTPVIAWPQRVRAGSRDRRRQRPDRRFHRGRGGSCATGRPHGPAQGSRRVRTALHRRDGWRAPISRPIVRSWRAASAHDEDASFPWRRRRTRTLPCRLGTCGWHARPALNPAKLTR